MMTAQLLPGGQKAKRWLVTFSLDADLGGAIPHGFNGPSDNFYLTPVTPQAYTGQVVVASVDATNINLGKTNAVGSAGAQVILTAYVPNCSL